jgi:hypothetical protein
MAKLTVYIPDDLLDRARASDPGANTSQLVQRGLECLSPRSPVAYAQRPAVADTLLAAAADRLKTGPARDYERGYRAALFTVTELGGSFWPELDGLSRRGFDLVGWATETRQELAAQLDDCRSEAKLEFEPPEWFEPMERDLGGLLDPFGDDATPARPFVRGYEAALRDAWEAVERPVSLDKNDPDAETQREVPDPEP